MMRAGLAQLAGLGEQPAGERRGRHQVGRELHRLERERLGAIALALLRRQRPRGEQHGALAPVGGLVDQPAPGVALEPVERARSSRRRRSGIRAPPARPRPAPGAAWRRLLGIEQRGDPGSLRRCASTNSPRRPSSLVSSRPAIAEGARRRPAVAGELRGLRAQQQRQRLARRDPARPPRTSLRAARASPAPTAISPRESAS